MPLAQRIRAADSYGLLLALIVASRSAPHSPADQRPVRLPSWCSKAAS